MRHFLTITLLLLSSSSTLSAPKTCKDIDRLVQNANEAISILSKQRFSNEVKNAFKNVIDQGTVIDPGFLKSLKGGIGVPTNRFNMKTKKKGYSDSLTYHFEKHGHEFTPPMKSKQEYKRRAKKFAQNIDKDTVTLKMGNRHVRYNPKTKEYISISPEGIGTYYVANLKYLNKTANHGPYKSIEEWLFYEKWQQDALNKKID